MPDTLKEQMSHICVTKEPKQYSEAPTYDGIDLQWNVDMIYLQYITLRWGYERKCKIQCACDGNTIWKYADVIVLQLVCGWTWDRKIEED